MASCFGIYSMSGATLFYSIPFDASTASLVVYVESVLNCFVVGLNR